MNGGQGELIPSPYCQGWLGLGGRAMEGVCVAYIVLTRLLGHCYQYRHRLEYI